MAPVDGRRRPCPSSPIVALALRRLCAGVDHPRAAGGTGPLRFRARGGTRPSGAPESVRPAAGFLGAVDIDGRQPVFPDLPPRRRLRSGSMACLAPGGDGIPRLGFAPFQAGAQVTAFPRAFYGSGGRNAAGPDAAFRPPGGGRDVGGIGIVLFPPPRILPDWVHHRSRHLPLYCAGRRPARLIQRRRGARRRRRSAAVTLRRALRRRRERLTGVVVFAMLLPAAIGTLWLVVERAKPRRVRNSDGVAPK